MNNEFNPKVSIVIPVYNGSNFMRDAIDSALSQTYKNLEIIVVNDGSKDDGETERIALSYGDRIRYFYKENGGTSTALNIGIENMTGDYFSWLSHDDMYYPNKIKRQVEELGKMEDKNTIIMSDLDGINEKGEKLYKTNYIEHIRKYPPREHSYIHPVIYNQTHGCTLLIHRKCFDEVGVFDEQELVAQDFEFFYRVFMKFPHKLIPEVLVTARDSSNRQGNSKRERCIIEYSNLFISIIECLTDKDIKLLAPDKISFYYDMQDFFTCAGYTIALDYINKKIVKCLQISIYDLVGNKFTGHDLHLYLREEGIDAKQLVLIKESNDLNTFAYDFEAKDSTKELLKRKIFLDADIVHLHLVHNILDINYLPIISRLKPTVITLHDPFFLGGHCVHHFDCTKWQTHCVDCPYLSELFPLDHDYSALNFELKKQAVQNSSVTVIVASEWLEKQVKQSPIWQDKKIYLLPFGINQELFRSRDIHSARKDLNLPEEGIVLFFQSDSGSYMGLDIIKRTLSELRNPEQITIITVGEKGGLDEFSNKYKIVEYGWINDDKLLVCLHQACDLFLMPSRQETFGMMAIEAMSCGKIVLAIKAEGSALPEVVNSPVCGLAVDEKEFTGELQRLIDHPGEILERGEKSLEFARKNYSKDAYIRRMIDIYREAMANHNSDASSKLILEQLKKYTSFASLSNVDGVLSPAIVQLEPAPGVLSKTKVFMLKVYRKLPNRIQRVTEPVLRPIYLFIKAQYRKIRRRVAAHAKIARFGNTGTQ
jgi:glycosyltransferase involved in cell wall biosynthesis